MKTTNNIILASSLSLLTWLTPAMADDTEIFFNEEVISDTESFQPNVLFVFDTSGSMGWDITSKEAYNPNQDYGGANSSTIYVYETDFSYTDTSINSSRNSCQFMIDKLASTPTAPTYIGKAAEWRPVRKKWGKVRNKNTNVDRTVECQEDAGIHGIDDTSTDLYARNGSNGPYTAAANNAISWSNIDERMYVSANYHFYLQNAPTVTRVKMDVMKEAAIDLVNSFSGINFGMMRFDDAHSPTIYDSTDWQGGFVEHHFSSVEDSKTSIINSINSLVANGSTPLTETLHEAHLYYSGGEVLYGTNSARDVAAINGDEYNSPINEEACQKNYIVYLTDGNPFEDQSSDGFVSGATTSCNHQDNASTANNTCLDELAGYMASHDYNDGPDSPAGIQNVQTYTIGFAIDMDLLRDTASAGGGKYYTANSSEELKTAFNEILVDILSNSSTFTAPAVSVNAFNSLQHRDELYFALFEPNKDPRWYGNLKKYKINSLGDVKDANEKDAIELSTGFFASESRSFWLPVTEDADGATVQEGGAAGLLLNNRKIYTVSGNYTPDTTPDNIVLTDIANRVAIDNDAITNDLYGLADDASAAERLQLIAWILGADVEDIELDDIEGMIDDIMAEGYTPSRFMGDPLHSRPVVVTYERNEHYDPENFTDSPLLDTVFLTTNDGSFRAVNGLNGKEIFSFIPQDLLSNQNDYFTNDADGIRRYGLDGPLTVWRQESNDPGINIDSAGEHVFAYFGMRRGGNNIYALDVTNTEAPELKWTIFGGTNGTTGFQDLGQTWSKPILSKVNWACTDLDDPATCTTKDVLFFGGGYDPIHDNADSATTGDDGAAIYMVDANSGDLLWSAGHVDSVDNHALEIPITNSIPGDITVADMDNDGSADIIFAIDILGHVWRIDINETSNTEANFATGGMIADLTDASNLRRFYAGPTVSLSQKRGRTPFFVITAGSGYTAHPKETDVVDRLYAIFEEGLFDAPETYTAITNDVLLDHNNAGVPADPEGNAPHGYYKDANPDGDAEGEKFLRKAITFSGITVYTSYVPNESADDFTPTCGLDHVGSGRLYAIDFVTGESVYTSDFLPLAHPGIPPEPVLLFIGEEDGPTKPILCIGTECFGSEDDENPWDEVTTQIRYWRENSQ